MVAVVPPEVIKLYFEYDIPRLRRLLSDFCPIVRGILSVGGVVYRSETLTSSLTLTRTSALFMGLNVGG